MVRVIMGVKGTGKTKQMIELINTAAKDASGSVVCIEREPKLTFDVSSKVRLLSGSEYQLKNYDIMKGFLSGLYAGNYDTTHVFIDSLTRIVPSDASDVQLEAFLEWLNKFAETRNISFVITISADASLATEGVKQFF